MGEVDNKIDELIENFSPETLRDFISIKNKNFELFDEKYELEDKDKFKEFGEITLIGKVKLEDDTDFCVFTIKYAGELTERTSKVKQFQLAKYLLSSEFFDAGFFVFYDENKNFRFSLVYAEYKGTKKKYNHYKRYTYYVQRGKPYRTFKKALMEIELKDLESIKQAFSVKPLIKEFYKEIQNWYAWALKENAYFPGGTKEENLIRLLTRLIFVWFLKEKSLVPQEIFDEMSLREIVKDFGEKDHYYNVILQNLFFATLNRPIKDRKFAEDKGYPANIKEFGVKSLFRYEKFLKIPKEEFIRLFEKVPFINGGLFECLDDDKNYVDGFSRNESKRAKIPDYLFFSSERYEDLSHFYGEKKVERVRGLINILKDYNFTADESSPVDVEVSLDPELLGHIFENLLAVYNEETKTTARKQTGSYYTPKEVVDFMAEEVLVQYFKTHTTIEEEKLRKLLSYSEEEVQLTEEEKDTLIFVIDQLKILDPAVGSGAFPMGVLHKLVHLLSRIDKDNTKWKYIQRRKALKEVEEIFNRTKDEQERRELLKELSENFSEKTKYPDYARKLYLIQNSIYGVDIQNIAVQICKLRFFLSLLIDQKIDPQAENYGIMPLPHLETNFVCADFLIGIENNKQLNFGDQALSGLKEKLKELYKKHFSIREREEKKKIQKEARRIREEMKEILTKLGWKSEDVEKIVRFDIFDQLDRADWFDPEWMFGVEDGFDIVIGNPPYVQLQKDGGKLAKRYKDQGYETFDRRGDVYVLFYEQGIKILKPNGYLCFITSNKWMRAGYGEKLREFFTKYNPVLLIDLGPGVFESSTVDTNILTIQKAKADKFNLKALTLKEPIVLERGLNIRGELSIPKEKVITEMMLNLTRIAWYLILEKLDKGPWFIGSTAEQRLKEKIEQMGKPLKEWDVKIYRGILTGLNEAFIITTEKRNEILANCRDEEERKRTSAIIKPILRGRDIKRYYYEWAGLWIIGTFPALHLDIEDYPALKEYFLSNFDIRQLEQSGKKYPKLGFNARKKTGNKWFETQDQIAYYHEFEKEKVMYSEIVHKPQFYYDTEKFYVEATAFLMTGKNVKYLCGLLNSMPVAYFFKKWYSGGGLGEEGYRYKKAFLINLPLPPITPENQHIADHISALVDKIITTKKQNPEADTTEWEREIDELVYRLYGLTKEEIKIIEEAQRS